MPTAVVGLRNVLPTPPATATANATGEATFTFSGTPSVGTWWYACCTVPLAPATAEFVLSLSGTAEAAWVGPQASSAVVVIAGTKITVTATKLTPGTAYVAQLRGGWETGEPQGIPLSGPSSFTVANVENITIETVNAIIVPVVDTVGVYTGRRPLTGTTTPVPIIPPTRSETYFSHLKIGWAVWGDIANTGTYIYIGDSAGSTPLDWARIPAGSGSLIGEFNVAWGNAWVARVTGKAGDVVNVWAA